LPGVDWMINQAAPVVPGLRHPNQRGPYIGQPKPTDRRCIERVLVAEYYPDGCADHRARPGIAVCMLIGIIFLPLIPFAIRRSQSTATKAMLAVLGVTLFCYNYTNALRSINHGYAADTSAARSRITSATSLDAKIAELITRRNAIPAHAIVCKGTVDAAQKARDTECGTGLGPRCRDRENALAAAQRDHALTERAATIEASLDAAKDELRKLGAVEKTADPTAAQLTKLAGLFWEKAAAPGADDAISANFPAFIALVVELTGGLMPLALVILFGVKPGTPPRSPKPKVKLPRDAKPADKESVMQWHGERITPRDGKHRLRAMAAFADYQAWCVANGMTPVNFTVFGRAMKGDLGVEKSKSTTNRVMYHAIGLKPRLRLSADSYSQRTVAKTVRDGRDSGDGGSGGGPQTLH
jgi:hypothetical protein